MIYPVTSDIYYKKGAQSASLILNNSNLTDIVNTIRRSIREVINSDCAENRLFFEGMYDESVRIFTEYMFGGKL